ncbi:MAG: Unknown protein [uncultured Thiotrichaceae bacterium]|uniref:Uncharacterized protein n=1 Tax=uncultured Thiotrichaceae bacterium TaxID=298394 RepID=A0A6S6UGL3_9GAMM|nr:MAG: Unknown protein [uncultured Thiotrichaceae bacterium]
MSLEKRFTEDEIFLLANTPSQIGAVMAFAEGSGLGTIKEMMANSKTVIAGIKKYPDNEIIIGVLPQVGDFKEAMSQAKAMRSKSIAKLEERKIQSSEQLHDAILKDCVSVAMILDQKATAQEADEYKQWAMEVAENVAKAAKEGGILGFGGTQVSDVEKDAFAQIAAALGTTTNLV